MAELGNDAFTSRRERKLAEKKTVAKSARSFSTALRSRGTELVAASQELVSEKIAPAVVARPRENRRVRWARALVMTVALAVVGTSALPAYAVDSSAHVDVAEYQALLAAAQSVSVGEASALSASRDGITVGAAAAPAYVNVNTTATAKGAVDVSSIKANGGLLAAALALVGMKGDCTMIVEQALRNLGYSVGDLGPMQFGAYGTVFTDRSQVQPGDIMMRGGHVAIYAGNGLAVHGGIGYNSYLTAMDASPNNYVAFVRVG